MKHSHPSVVVLVAVVMVLALFGVARSESQHNGVIAAAVGSGFNYQGKLLRGGNPANTTCDFNFGLWDAGTGGTNIGTNQNLTGIAVVNGVFTVVLDFNNQFTGSSRWLETAVKCAGDADFTTLAPRQGLSAVPYALGLQPGATIDNPTGYGLLSFGGVGSGIFGSSSDPNGNGVYGNANGAGAAGVYGVNNTGPAVWGRSGSGSGVYGTSNGYAVYGSSTNGFGVYGTSANAGMVGQGYVGVQGNANGTTDSQGVRGEDGANGASTTTWAGVFNGRLYAGTLIKLSGSFRIDHPLDPTNKYLSHSFVESPDMKNIYDGVVTLDSDGAATVALPSYFEALNMDFRYQLTCIGGYAPVYVAEEVSNNQFKIAGGTPGLKVSWQVTGIRHDPYANDNRIKVEEAKPAAERGRYLYPAGYGQGQNKAETMLQPAKPPANAASQPAIRGK